jgi:hypothetical protein
MEATTAVANLELYSPTFPVLLQPAHSIHEGVTLVAPILQDGEGRKEVRVEGQDLIVKMKKNLL